jgi:predicted GNAT family acetyltransferase
MADAPAVVDNEGANRLEVSVNGRVASLSYRQEGDRLVLVHTHVPDELEGHGLGGMLVAAAIDRARQQRLTVVPRCPFARGWLERHPDVARRVSIE